MKHGATGGPNRLRRRVDLLFGIVFLVATVRWVVQGWLDGSSPVDVYLDTRFWLVGSISGLFFLSIRFPALRIVEPWIFLATAILPFAEYTESIFGFGLFAVGSILLFVDGRLSRRPVLGLVLLGCYLVALLIASAILTHTDFEMALAILLFMAGFLLFLFLTFQDKIVVFVRAARPVFRLSKAGLTEKEAQHLLSLLDGKTTKEIAWELGVKESTIRNSLSRAYHRLGFRDKTQLLQWAERHEVRA